MSDFAEMAEAFEQARTAPDATDRASAFVKEVALSVLDSWYVTFDAFKSHRHGDMRRLALKSKCIGIVGHDRTLIVAERCISCQDDHDKRERRA